MLTIEILNPKTSVILGEMWVWFSWFNGAYVEPWFFGQKINVPTDPKGEVITLQFSGEPFDFDEQKQRLAQTLKVAPFYDPVMIDLPHRDDPDAILAGYSAVYHVDRITGLVTISDYITGEDGVEIFTGDEVPYDSVKVEIASAPPEAVEVFLDVGWEQKALGTVSFGSRSFQTKTGNGLLSDWPKTLADLGGGWSVRSAGVYDSNRISEQIVANSSLHYQNNAGINQGHDPDFSTGSGGHHIGDLMSYNVTQSKPLSNVQEFKISEKFVTGVISSDPDTKDIQPASVDQTFIYVGNYDIHGSLVLRYHMQNQRTERLHFKLFADIQHLLPSRKTRSHEPAVEKITLSGGDVGQPLVQVLSWFSIKDSDVNQGTFVYNEVTGSYQLAISLTGHTGTIEPNFDTVPGNETADGTVTWVSLGTNFSISAINWNKASYIRVGQLLLPEIDDWVYWRDLVPFGTLRGVNISEGTIVKSIFNNTFHICIDGGESGLNEPGWAGTYGANTGDNEVTWACLGSNMPTGQIYFMALNSGQTNSNYLPDLDYTIGNLTIDNNITWKCVGTAADFAPIPIGDRSRRSFFPTDRGLQTVEYALCVARSHLRQKSRVVEAEWDFNLERFASLSCRKNATLLDDRYPGGISGKIVNYSVRGNGDTGEYMGTIKVLCAVGHGGTVTSSAGTPDYVEDDTFEDAPTILNSSIISIAGDVGYSVPVDDPLDDGMIHPLTRQQVTIVDIIHHGNPNLASAWGAAVDIAALEQQMAGDHSLEQSVATQESIQKLSQRSFDAELSKHRAATWWELELKPVSGNNFEENYNLSVTDLKIEEQVIIEASG